MNKDKIKKIFGIVLLVYAVFVVSFYFLSGEQLRYKESKGNIVMPEADSVTEEINNVTSVTQEFVNTVDNIEEIALVFTKFYREAEGKLTFYLIGDNRVLYRTTIDLSEVPEQHRVYITPETPIRNVGGKTLKFVLRSNAEVNLGVAAMLKTEDVPETSFVYTNGEKINATLCFSVTGTTEIVASNYYWLIMGSVGILLALLFYKSLKDFEEGRVNYLIAGIRAVERYEFLISQLVIRDFKSKYKRSILGIFWSFLNPLMTMTVQFLVFSTLFGSDTVSYPIYLLSGVVCFSFFSECTTMCLTSISGNSRLITKVYIPKYIFPLSRTISSSINLVISLVPLFLACLVLGISLRPQALLFFYFLLCLVVFSLGIGLFLSALMVFFRDIQFLWTVLTQIWMYATPIFYSAEIIPDKFKFVVRLNPLYHFIGNARTCLINGISPEPAAYIYCLLFALVSLLIGAITFKKTQDKFALYL